MMVLSTLFLGFFAFSLFPMIATNGGSDDPRFAFFWSFDVKRLRLLDERDHNYAHGKVRRTTYDVYCVQRFASSLPLVDQCGFAKQLASDRWNFCDGLS